MSERFPDDAAERMTEPGLVEILSSYAAAGFDVDAFVTEAGLLECGACRSSLNPARVDVHSIRRLEGASDPADMSAVLALVCPVCGAHATAVLRFGPEASAAEAEVWDQTRDRRASGLLPGDAAPSEGDAEPGRA